MPAQDRNYSTPETARKDSFNQKIPFKVLNKLDLFFCPINTDFMLEKFKQLALSVEQERLRPENIEKIALIRPDNLIYIKHDSKYNFNLPTIPADHYHLLPKYDLDTSRYTSEVDYAAGAKFIHEALSKGYSTYLQVQLFNDASATIVATYLIRYQHYNATQAMHAVKKACAHTEFSQSQAGFLLGFAKQNRKLEGKVNHTDTERAPKFSEESKKSPTRRDILIAFAIAAAITLGVLAFSIAAISFAQPHLAAFAIQWGITTFGSLAASATLLAVFGIAASAIVGGISALARYLFKRDKPSDKTADANQDSEMVSAMSTHADVRVELGARPVVAQAAPTPIADKPTITLPAPRKKKKPLRESLDPAPSPSKP